MLPQQKILRVFKLIKLLTEKPRRNAKELARILDTSADTIYRYVNLLDDIGYLIERDHNDCYFIFEHTGESTATFELEEMELLNQLINSIEASHPLKQGLRQKVYVVSPLLPLADEIVDKTVAKTISRINTAIVENKQIKLLKYHSTSSNSIKDRLVEPIKLEQASSQLCAFDVESNEVKHFKIKRIFEVEVLDTHCEYSKSYNPTDCFGFTSNEPISIKLSLSLRAFQLLTEEFPDLRLYITKQAAGDKPYLLHYEVRSLIGIGRFILGLPGEIDVIAPQSLITYLKNRVNQFSFAQVANEGL